MSISSQELKEGLEVIEQEWQQLDDKADWDAVKLLQQHDATFLRITRSLNASTDNPYEQQDEDEIEEDDDEALRRTKPAERPLAIYDIVHSPSYQVPVLYVSFKNRASGRPPSIEELYQMLVPSTQRTSMQTVGQLGAITLTEHPITGIPAYFVHPCRTREALEPALEGRTVKPAEYVALWLGTIGASVGLNVPLPLATRLNRGRRIRKSTLEESEQ
ncbi:hypothetical protein PRZ48_008022 [Zasmidium cellare]|uniref:Ubiquitin-like-conjugating enzyme ATG10 n=1 Tax=Zasmidium cellare TaxID=395010 RepID=A0ABR0EF20_ZASCE|nr:hypothetical protein PRZ48_008022 [Zasmidium cellare]